MSQVKAEPAPAANAKGRSTRHKPGEQFRAVCALLETNEPKLCEILHSRPDPNNPSQYQYYVHFEKQDSRLDAWVPEAQLLPYKPAAASPAVSKSRTRSQRRKSQGQKQAADAHEVYVRNVEKIVFGDDEIRTWYFSPYPDEFGASPLLYICPRCLKYMRAEFTYRRHLARCPLRQPPGDEIYRDKKFSLYEIDGRRQKLYCQNLCLLTRLFLEHKTLEFDVDPFLFYVLCVPARGGMQIVGYFSKEKDATNILACILTIPCFQRRGYGRALIEFAYMLARREGRIGGPEEPLSDLGERGFHSYWRRQIVEYLTHVKGTSVSIEQITRATFIQPSDVLKTLHTMKILQFYKDQYILYLSPKVLKMLQDSVSSRQQNEHQLEERFLHWTPYPSMEINNIDQVFNTQ